jgi:hypothetical protein
MFPLPNSLDLGCGKIGLSGFDSVGPRFLVSMAPAFVKNIDDLFAFFPSRIQKLQI